MGDNVTFSLSFWGYDQIKGLRQQALNYPIEDANWNTAKNVGVRCLFQAGFLVVSAVGLVETVLQALGGLVAIAASCIPLGKCWEDVCDVCVKHLISGTIFSASSTLLSLTGFFFQPWDTADLHYLSQFENCVCGT